MGCFVCTFIPVCMMSSDISTHCNSYRLQMDMAYRYQKRLRKARGPRVRPKAIRASHGLPFATGRTDAANASDLNLPEISSVVPEWALGCTYEGSRPRGIGQQQGSSESDARLLDRKTLINITP